MDDRTAAATLGESHRRRLAELFAGQVRFSAGAQLPVGFGYLDDHGVPDPSHRRELYLNCRMTHLFSLASSLGLPGAAAAADHGLAALTGLFHDEENGGWVSQVDDAGQPIPGRKLAYDHAFVVLAAAGATAAGRPGAASVLDEALTVISTRFWEAGPGLSAESFAVDFTDPESYRGGNSNMHLLEACIAAGDVTGDRLWTDRALSIAAALVNRCAREFGWRLVEHFDADWNPLPDYNHDHPDDQFRPYGTTVGHWLEWARLLVQLAAGLRDAPAWLTEAAIALFDHAVRSGWAADGTDGFIYTLDFDDRVIVDFRLHWVLCEAIGAAAALFAATGDHRFLVWYQQFWDHADRFFIDPTTGSWRHELDRQLVPHASVWAGRPDPYHVATAVLVPQLPLSPCAAVALAR